MDRRSTTRALRARVRPLAIAAAACWLACGSEAPAPSAPVSESRDARHRAVRLLRAQDEARVDPSDGGGRAWLEGAGSPARPRVVAGGPVRLTVVYEAGPLGVAVGGSVALQISPFWGWSRPQASRPDEAGFTSFATDAEGVVLVPRDFPAHRLELRVEGRALAAGERIRFVYGAGEARARADRWAERGERLWIAVDGDGDGARRLVEDSPSVDVVAGPGRRLLLTLPSTAATGRRATLRVAVLDGQGNAGAPFEGHVVIDPASAPGWELPARIELGAEDLGRRAVEVGVGREGVHRLRASLEQGGRALPGARATSNPVVVEERPRLLWGDLHGHSQLSDGTGSPDDYYRYARDVAGLDVAALTDHDHWGLRHLDRDPRLWDRIRAAAEAFHQPGAFVTLLGFEWTSWLQGHRHVLYFTDDGPVVSSLDPGTDTPPELWRALEGLPALTFAHHSAGGAVSTNWDFAPDPVLEPVTEIVSHWGSSEAAETPGRIEPAVEGNYVRDVLDRGFRFGFVGSGDGHDGHPGLTRLAYRRGGLAAIFAERLDRDSVLAALRARRVYATNGPRIALFVSLDGAPMGAALPGGTGPHRLELAVYAEAPLERVDLVRRGGVAERVPGEGRLDLSLRRDVPALTLGDYLYVRAVQSDGGAAWSSPFYRASP